jgi:thiol-disulfide isomerase/thioredoxin
MKKSIILILVTFVSFQSSLLAGGFQYEKEIGSLKFNIPSQKSTRSYLGIREDAGQFSLPQLRQGILIVEIFNMYCPHCQHYAPKVNELYTVINKRPDTRNRVYMMGIGVGNSPYEVDVFRKKYNVAFPLFDDKGYSAANSLDGVLTPYFFGISIDGKGNYRVFYSLNGGFDNAEDFLNNLLKAASQAR